MQNTKMKAPKVLMPQCMYIYCSTKRDKICMHYTNQFVNFISAQNKSENYEMRANANQNGQEVVQTTKDCVTYRRFRKALSIVNTIKET